MEKPERKGKFLRGDLKLSKVGELWISAGREFQREGAATLRLCPRFGPREGEETGIRRPQVPTWSVLVQEVSEIVGGASV